MIEYLRIDNVLDKECLQTVIYKDLEHDYYWSDDFSCEFYITLAKAGFITIGYVHRGNNILLLDETYPLSPIVIDSLGR